MNKVENSDESQYVKWYGPLLKMQIAYNEWFVKVTMNLPSGQTPIMMQPLPNAIAEPAQETE